MRVLLLFRGAPGCGKSTFIEKSGLKPYTLSADDIRLMCASPTLQVNGNVAISQENDTIVWKTLFNILDVRMQNGEFTVIDATNSKTSEMSRYKQMASEYRYRIYCIDMTDIPIEEVKRRNSNRTQMKIVPEEVIDNMYSRFATQKIPSGIKVLKPNELDTIWYKPTDLNKYKKIHVIGDIHGCYSVLMDYFDYNGGIKEDECYIFTGDYVDRGIENAEVMKFLCKQIEYPNVICLEGNHEIWLRRYSNDVISESKEFEFITKPQLNAAMVSKKDVREFCRKLSQCAYFIYNNNKFIVTHGGISSVPFNLTVVPTKQMIRGVGRYNDVDDVDASFSSSLDNIYQIHGHRNPFDSDIKSNDKTYNLEGKVEFGGNLRAVQISKNGIETFEIKNNVFKKIEEEVTPIETPENMTVYELVGKMRANRNIRESKFGRISSFNFTSRAFMKGAWDGLTNKARGLFIDTENYNIAARGYDKFFNINEMNETKLENLHLKLHFPVTAYVKENGFLGIVGWDYEHDDLLIASKSTPVGDFAVYLRNALYSVYGEEKLSKIKNYIKENNVSFLFECCDMDNDPHIIQYSETKVFLLDIVKNQLEYEKLPYDELTKVANEIGLEFKKKAIEINSWEDFVEWYYKVTDDDYKFNGEYIEGFVIEDSIGFMTKLKLHYYKTWKKLRVVANSVLKYGYYKYTGSLLTPIENEFHGYCKYLFENLPKEERLKLKEKSETNIVHLRNEFMKWYAERLNNNQSGV